MSNHPGTAFFAGIRVFLGLLRQRSLSFPPPNKSTAQCRDMNPCFSRPLCKSKCFSIIRDEVSDRPIHRLFLLGCPSAIHCVASLKTFLAFPARIAAIAVYSIQGMQRRRLVAHVLVKCLKRLPPPLAHINTAFGVARLFGLAIPSHDHSRPAHVNWTARHAVAGHPNARSLPRQTAAAFCLPVKKNMRSNTAGIPAIAPANPLRLGFVGVTFNCREPSKSHSRQVLRPLAARGRIRNSHEKPPFRHKWLEPVGRTIRPLARVILA